MRAALHPGAALLLPLLLFWDAWRLLAGRFGDQSSFWPLVLVALVVATPAVRRIAAGHGEPVPLVPLCGLLVCYIVAVLAAPALVECAIAVVGSVLICRTAAGGRMAKAPLAGLALLALPVLPSLDFYLAYPMRLVCAWLAAMLLRLNGIQIGLEGVALKWNGSLLLFDAACSGIRMLWACLFLVSGIALAAGFRPLLYARAIAIAFVLAIAGNAVRAASLFYVENGFVERLHGPAGHEAVGILAFLLLGLAAVRLVAPRQWRTA
jgi:exosortase/archaeosortase family protein